MLKHRFIFLLKVNFEPPTVPPADAGSDNVIPRLRVVSVFGCAYAVTGRRVAAPRTRSLLYFSGKLLLFDVQSSITEKVQKARYHLHLRRGGARALAWE
jgi:hypothetical protein